MTGYRDARRAVHRDARRAVRRDARRDEGQVTLLLVGYAVVVLALLLTVASASAVHLTRHRLLAVADAAALDAADALDRQRYYAELGGAGPTRERLVALTDASVRASVSGYLTAAPAATALGDVRVVDGTGCPDGFTAQVALTVRARLPLLPALLGDRAAVTVTVTARARAREPAP